MERDALLILGPTGSGKSPLGDAIERVGWRSRPCRHFDFGRALRRAATQPCLLSEAEAAIVARVLAEGSLLEDHEFFVAEGTLQAALATFREPTGLIVLNGLPRHVGQALAVDRLVRVQEILHLEAAPGVLGERIRRNTGGDRLGRTDDAEAAVRARLERFEARTRPLLAHYRQAGATLRTLEVGVDTQAADLLRALGA